MKGGGRKKCEVCHNYIPDRCICPKKVKVINRRLYKGPYTYIGRGTVFGNKHPVTMGRVKCLAEYNKDFKEAMKRNTPLRQAMYTLVDMTLMGQQVVLGCSCKPQKCHGDILAQWIDREVKMIIGLVSYGGGNIDQRHAYWKAVEKYRKEYNDFQTNACTKRVAPVFS